MFTGLIQGLGRIKPLSGDLWQITLINSLASPTGTIMKDLSYGDSVSVDGVCLTVEELLQEGFIATASPETLQRTTLGTKEVQSRYVNLETSLRVGGKVGGHFVMGHVDGIGELVSSAQIASSWEMTFIAPPDIARYIVPKGSIAINGISLTVARYQPEHYQFTVAVIPVTYSETNLNCLVPGSLVNLEADILGKYVENFLSMSHQEHQTSEEITPAFLMEHGYV
ncbi:riboflavin synthase [Cylindrospermopsis raciborskii C04]|uniref:Riboflavin synthase n=1 Tax=Cylindrospermopsis raciborskii C07 TaxID=2014886 RepID=A0ABX4WKL1_9CYAN|nr:riboflavin synthase [Cylindrospermopsis raciborskii]PNJ93007.1 riboflavin synthase [Cylindrospermopsis raciborskii C03]PNJ93742.1 riboflavin synthase [Cylindrospermopsis raciborskii C04]PNJ94741.1 riboflavin synthase [Cylindrospermopsis raciborskii C07]